MSELGLDTRYNLIDNLKLVFDGKFVPWGEVLTEDNPFLFDLAVLPANGILSNEGSREVSLPTPQIIKVGDGHDSSTVRWDKFKEEISIFVDRASIPKHTLDLQPDKGAFRAKVEDRHMEGMGQGVTNHFIYGTSVATPEKFDGLSVRYSVPDATDPTNPSSASADFGVFDAGGSGDDTMSVFLIQHGVDKIHGISPANDPMMGIQKMDAGLVYATAENSKERQEHRTEFEWKIGLNIVDLRSVARIRNIESVVANLDASFLQLIFQAEEEIFRGSDQIFAYVPKRMMTFLHIMAEAKQNVIYDKNNIYGILLYRIGKILIRTMDALSITETAVAAV
jgi:hypothetical protein